RAFAGPDGAGDADAFTGCNGESDGVEDRPLILRVCKRQALHIDYCARSGCLFYGESGNGGGRGRRCWPEAVAERPEIEYLDDPPEACDAALPLRDAVAHVEQRPLQHQDIGLESNELPDRDLAGPDLLDTPIK